jgi:hypothetical protein
MKGHSLSVAILKGIAFFSISLISIASFQTAYADHISYDFSAQTVTVDGTSYPVAGFCSGDDPGSCIIGVSGTSDDVPVLRATGIDPDADDIASDFETNTLNTNPNAKDSDGDGVFDTYEVMSGLGHPDDPDSDDDGLSDGQEEPQNTNPFDVDTDDDGLTDFEEVVTYGTDPGRVDSDSDGINDGDEVSNGTDPLNFIVGAPLDTDREFNAILTSTGTPHFIGSDDFPPLEPIRAGMSVRIFVSTTSFDVKFITINLVDPIGEIHPAFELFSSPFIRESNQEFQLPADLPGHWIVRVLFYSDREGNLLAAREIPMDLSPLVIPEFPIGAIAGVGTSLAALGGYLAFKIRRTNKD